MSIVLDLIVISIIILCVVISAKKGFVRSLIETVGLVAAVAVAFFAAEPLAESTYDRIIEPPLVSAVSEKNLESASSVSVELWEELPGFVSGTLERAGITREGLNETVSEKLGGGVSSAAEAVSREVIRPVTVSVLKLLYSVVLMLLLLLLVRLSAKPINRLFSFGLLGRANRLSGAVIGILKGAALAVLFCTVTALAVSLSKNGFWIFTPENIENTYIFNFFALLTA